MVRMIRWLLGYVRFRFCDGFVEGFINDCFASSLNIKNLIRDGGDLCAECSPRTYFALRNIARANGGTLRITAKYGPIFWFLKIRNRWGLFVGAAISIVIFCVLSNFVWSINIVGNNKIPQSDILLFLEENDVAVGTYSDSIDRDVIENLMMSSFDKCAWAHINIDGTTLTLEIDEIVEKSDTVDTDIITNVKASKDGIIVKATTYDGWQMVQAGDGVCRGDLLISGVYEGETTKRNVFAHARGEVLAKVDNDFALTVSRQQCQKQYIDIRQYRYLYLFGIRLPLFFGSSECANADVDFDYSYLVLNGRELPLGIVTKTSKIFDVAVSTLSDEDLNILITDEIKRSIDREYADAEIISQNIDISLGANEAVAKGKIVAIEQIGQEIRLNIKK